MHKLRTIFIALVSGITVFPLLWLTFDSQLLPFEPIELGVAKIRTTIYLEKQESDIAAALSVPSTQVQNNARQFPFGYIIPAKDICSTSNRQEIFLMIVVCSAVGNIAQRQAIRETWGSVAYKQNTGSVRLAFLLGTSEDQNASRLVQEEAMTHRDVIQVDFHDSYRNLTYKSMSLLKWVSENCPDVSYVLKTDDDMYVNVPNLLLKAKSMKTKTNVMFGVLYRNASVFRMKSSKWYVSRSEYPGNVYPDFLSGTAYAMSGDTVPKLYTVSLNQTFLFLEDVFVTGVCAETVGVIRQNCAMFSSNKRPSTGCGFRNSITGHYVTIPEMRKIWNELQNSSLKCKLDWLNFIHENN